MPHSFTLQRIARMKISKLAVFFVTFTLGHRVACARAADTSCLPPPLPASPAETPLNQQAAGDAWAAFKSADYAVAIAKASECIDRYQPAADKIQTILEESKADLPTGEVSLADRERIERYRILHDVATCLLIKAWAEEKQGKRGEAKKTFAKVKKYSFARTSNRQGDPV